MKKRLPKFYPMISSANKKYQIMYREKEIDIDTNRYTRITQYTHSRKSLI